MEGLTGTAQAERPEDRRRRIWNDALEATSIGGLALFAGTAAATGLHVPPGPLLLAVTLAGLLTTASVAIRTGSLALPLYAQAWGLLVLGWCIWAEYGHPWQAWPLAGLACAVMILGPAGAWLISSWDKELARLAAEELAKLDDAERRRIAQVWAKRGCPVKVAALTSDRSGTTARLELPDDGSVTMDSLDTARPGVEVALRTQPGSIHLEEGGHAGEVIMRLREADVLAEEVPMPDDYSPRSVNQPLRLGLRESGRVFAVLFREVCALIVGQRGSGKSNMANVWIAQLGRCTDVLIFVVDLKQGRMARPWVMPWLEGKCHRPAVDWVATTRDEAWLMLNAMHRAGEARALSGIGGEKHTPSREHPAIALVTDETAVILGPGGPRKSEQPGVRTNREMSELAADIINRFRSEAVDAVLFALRGTADMAGGTNLKAQAALRIGLAVETVDEAGYILESSPVAVKRWLSRLRHPGSAIAQVRKDPPVIFKVDRLDYDRIAGEAAIANARWRPEPDPVIAAAMGVQPCKPDECPGCQDCAWANRWVRAQPWLDVLRGTPVATAPPPPAPDPGPGPDAWEDITAHLPDLAAMDVNIDERWLRMRQIMHARGSHPVTVAWLMRLFEEDEKQGRGKAPARKSVYRWLERDIADGRTEKITGGYRIKQQA